MVDLDGKESPKWTLRTFSAAFLAGAQNIVSLALLLSILLFLWLLVTDIFFCVGRIGRSWWLFFTCCTVGVGILSQLLHKGPIENISKSSGYPAFTIVSRWIAPISHLFFASVSAIVWLLLALYARASMVDHLFSLLIICLFLALFCTGAKKERVKFAAVEDPTRDRSVRLVGLSEGESPLLLWLALVGTCGSGLLLLVFFLLSGPHCSEQERIDIVRSLHGLLVITAFCIAWLLAIYFSGGTASDIGAENEPDAGSDNGGSSEEDKAED